MLKRVTLKLSIKRSPLNLRHRRDDDPRYVWRLLPVPLWANTSVRNAAAASAFIGYWRHYRRFGAFSWPTRGVLYRYSFSSRQKARPRYWFMVWRALNSAAHSRIQRKCRVSAVTADAKNRIARRPLSLEVFFRHVGWALLTAMNQPNQLGNVCCAIEAHFD